MFSNEWQATLLSLEAIPEILGALSFDHSEMELEIRSSGDSAVLSHLFNPQFYLKEVLIRGYMYIQV